MTHAQSDIARLLILLSRRTNGLTLKTPSYFSCIHNWVAGGCRWVNSFGAAVWVVETGLHGAFPMYRFMLDGIARWRLLERKRSPAIREVTPAESPLSRIQQTPVRSESLPATDLHSSWPMFDPSQYWPPQAPLDFLPSLTPSPVEQLQVQQSRPTIPIPPSEGAEFRPTPSMISSYRYPTFDPFAALEQTQGLSYNETSEMPMQTDLLELQTNITSDPDTRSDSSSASVVQRDVEMDSAIIDQLDVGTREASNNNECFLEDPESAVSDYDNCPLPSPIHGDIHSESTSQSPITASPVENPARQTRPVESNAVDRRPPRLSSTLPTTSE